MKIMTTYSAVAWWVNIFLINVICNERLTRVVGIYVQQHKIEIHLSKEKIHMHYVYCYIQYLQGYWIAFWLEALGSVLLV